MKVCKWIAVALIAFSIVWLFGTAGMSDAGTICFNTAFLRAVLGLILLTAGLFGAYIIEKKENEK